MSIKTPPAWTTAALDFALDTMVIGYFASPDAMKSVARRISGQLK